MDNTAELSWRAAARWARAAAVFSATTILLFVIALAVLGERTAPSSGELPGPYAGALRVVLVAAGIMGAVATVWRYERLARGRFPGRPRWRVFGAWWAVLVMTFLLVGFPPSSWAVAAWVAALGWALAVSRGAWLYRRAYP